MNVLTSLTGQSVVGDLREPRGMLSHLHVEPSPGCHVKVSLGSAGLFIRRGDFVVAYPLEVILNHVAEIAPDLLSPVPAPAALAATAR